MQHRIPLFFCLSLLLPACLNWLDVGHDAKSDSAPTDPAVPASDDAFATTQALTKYCAARADFEDRCKGYVYGCELARTKDCMNAFSFYRPAYVKALATCGMPATCTLYNVESDTCLQAESGKTPPSDAAIALGKQLCAEFDTSPTCEQELFVRSQLVDNTWTAAGRGVRFVDLDDDHIAQVVTDCFDQAKPYGARGGWGVWDSCAQRTIQAFAPGAVYDACTPIDTAIPSGGGEGTTPPIIVDASTDG